MVVTHSARSCRWLNRRRGLGHVAGVELVLGVMLVFATAPKGVVIAQQSEPDARTPGFDLLMPTLTPTPTLPLAQALDPSASPVVLEIPPAASPPPSPVNTSGQEYLPAVEGVTQSPSSPPEITLPTNAPTTTEPSASPVNDPSLNSLSPKFEPPLITPTGYPPPNGTDPPEPPEPIDQTPLPSFTLSTPPQPTLPPMEGSVAPQPSTETIPAATPSAESNFTVTPSPSNVDPGSPPSPLQPSTIPSPPPTPTPSKSTPVPSPPLAPPSPWISSDSSSSSWSNSSSLSSSGSFSAGEPNTPSSPTPVAPPPVDEASGTELVDPLESVYPTTSEGPTAPDDSIPPMPWPATSPPNKPETTTETPTSEIDKEADELVNGPSPPDEETDANQRQGAGDDEAVSVSSMLSILSIVFGAAAVLVLVVCALHTRSIRDSDEIGDSPDY